MALLFDQAVFLHCPKTGGVFIREALRAQNAINQELKSYRGL